MAVTSIWGVHGSVYTVTKYAANPAKTRNDEYGKALAYHQHRGGVEQVMEYTADKMKTEKQLFCTGVNPFASSMRHKDLLTSCRMAKEYYEL